MLDHGERFLGLDSLVSLARNGTGVFDTVSNKDPSAGSRFVTAALRTVNWNVAIEFLNGWYDRLVEYARLDSPAERQLAFDNFEYEMKDLAIEAATRGIGSKRCLVDAMPKARW